MKFATILKSNQTHNWLGSKFRLRDRWAECEAEDVEETIKKIEGDGGVVIHTSKNKRLNKWIKISYKEECYNEKSLHGVKNKYN